MEIFNFDVQNAENHSEWTSKNLNLVFIVLTYEYLLSL